MAVLKSKGLFLWLILLFVVTIVPQFSQGQSSQRRVVNFEALNSPASEVAPTITLDGNTIYFTSDREGGAGRQDFWVSKRVGGVWTKPVNLRELNTPQNEGPDCITPDGGTMYYTGCNRMEDGSEKCDILVTTMGPDGKWKPGKNLGPPINTEYEEANSSISPDGKTLYFSSNRPGGQGGYDVWMSTLGQNGKWTNPVNLGPTVNTPAWEGIAFAAADGTTLYFSSSGHGGFGNADIFSTKRKPDGSWEEPVNMGGLINSPYNDIYFAVPASGDLAYFSSSAEGGLGREDLYAIPKNLILDSKDYVIVRGRVSDAVTNQSLAAMLTVTGGSQGELTSTSNPKTGNYTLRLKIGAVYRINASADGYTDRTETVDLREADPFHIVVRDIKLTPVTSTQVAEAAEQTQEEVDGILIEGGKLIVRNILFDFDKHTIKSEGVPILEKLVNFMNNNPTVVLRIAGYTDSFGSAEYNKGLSSKRANAVRNYMALRGVQSHRMVAEGHGESNLVAQDDPNAAEGNPENRRVEFSLVQGTYRPTSNPNTTMRGKQPPEDVRGVQVASLSPTVFAIPSQLEVRNAAVAVNVINRGPVKPGSQFSSSVGKLYFFTRVVGADEDTKVTHLWYYHGRLIGRAYLGVTSDDFRTWSYLNINPAWSGGMRVECVDSNGNVLNTIKFTLTK